MNITTLFRSNFEDQLLYNVERENVSNSWSDKKLFTNIGRISKALLEKNIMRGDRILILAGNRGETFEFSLAVFNIGAIAVPVNPYIGNEVLYEIVTNMEPRCCLYEGEINKNLLHILASTCNLYITLNSQDKNVNVNELSYTDMLTHECTLKYGNFPAEQPALIIHTSGSQGFPKVICMSHEYLFYYFHYHDLVHRQFTDSSGEGELQKPIISVFHPSHLASYSIAFQGLLMRRPTYLMNGFSPRPYLTLLSQLGCRIAMLVPSMYTNLLKEQSIIDTNDYSALELCAAVGEPSPETLADKVEQAFGTTYFSGYGLTECLPGIAHTWYDLHQKRIPRGSSGRLLFEEVRLVDKQGNDGDLGELWLRNPTVHCCYIDDSLNQVKIDSEGWLRTGDLFYRDESGNFYHKGRIDDMFVFNGKNIYPAEIESVLIKYPLIEKVIAAPVMDPQHGTIPAVLIQTYKDLNEFDIISLYVKTGPLYALPKFIKIINELPVLGSGKIDRNACKLFLQEAYLNHLEQVKFPPHTNLLSKGEKNLNSAPKA